MHQRVTQAFSSSGIPTLIIHTILDDLQLEANALLTELRPGIELQFHISKNDKDTLDLTYRIDGKERDWEQLGGGQKVFISLSLKLGLSIVIQRRMGVDIKFLELDEVDQPLDKAGVDAYADVIKKWQDKFKIFVITHNDSLKDKFTHAILVESDGANGSEAKVVTNW
jgi:DNA repair exonuclease SbcCD ATPase subunit